MTDDDAPADLPAVPTGPKPLAPSDEQAEPVDPEVDRYLRAQAIVDAINENNPFPLEPIPKGYVFKKRNAGDAAIALHSAFELNGGVPRLVAFARTHPKDFYAMWARLVAAEESKGHTSATQIIFQSAVPKNPLDDVSIDSQGRVISAEVRSVDFVDADE
jgi:hypothetical protein